VLVPSRVLCSLLPFFHETVSEQELELGVGAARGRRRVGLAEPVLGSDMEGSVALLAEEKKHRVGEGVQGVVRPVLGRGLWLAPAEGKPGTRVTAGDGSVVGGMAV